MALDLTQTTFVIPVRLESPDRAENLRLCLDYLLHHLDTNIFIQEEDHEPRVPDHIPEGVLKRCCYRFEPQTTPYFHRTRIRNDLIKRVATPVVAIYDCDVLLPPSNYLAAQRHILAGGQDMVYPYDGVFYDVPKEFHPRIRVRLSLDEVDLRDCRLVHQNSPGGCVFVHRERYFSAGLENEHCRGWGYEDDERVQRLLRLGYRVARVTSGPLFHLTHSRGPDSSFTSPLIAENKAELEKVLRLPVPELERYIESWPWTRSDFTPTAAGGPTPGGDQDRSEYISGEDTALRNAGPGNGIHPDGRCGSSGTSDRVQKEAGLSTDDPRHPSSNAAPTVTVSASAASSQGGDPELLHAMDRHLREEYLPAMQAYLAKLERDPNNEQVLCLLGVLLCQAEEFHKADDLLRAAVQVHPKSAALLNNAGYAARQAGDLAEAVSLFRHAVSLEPAMTSARSNLSYALLQSQIDSATVAEDASLSAVITCYESGDSIGQTIMSLVNQTRPPTEIIVTDDGSSERACEYVRALLEIVEGHGIETRFVTHERTSPYRLNTVRNNGIAAASGDLVFFTDGDILIPKGLLARHRRIHAESPRSLYLFATRRELLENGQIGAISDWAEQVIAETGGREWHEMNLPSGKGLPSASFKRSLWEGAGGFDEAFNGHWGCDESEFVFRLKHLLGVMVTTCGMVYHIPHDAAAGSRDAGRNQALYRQRRNDLMASLLEAPLWARRENAAAARGIGRDRGDGVVARPVHVSNALNPADQPGTSESQECRGGSTCDAAVICTCPGRTDRPVFSPHELSHLRYNGLVSPRHKLLYVATPKAACTSIKRWFADLTGIPADTVQARVSAEVSPELVVHPALAEQAVTLGSLDEPGRSEILTSGTYLRFAVVRNPYTRIFSAWQSKVLLQEPAQIAPYTGTWQHLPTGSVEDLREGFTAFLRHILEHEHPNIANVHWMPQTRLVMPERIPYTFIGRVEDLQGVQAKLSAHLAGLGIRETPGFPTSNEALVRFHPELISDEAAGMIREIYAADFEAFDYPTSLPAAAESLDRGRVQGALQAVPLIRARHRRIGTLSRCAGAHVP